MKLPAVILLSTFFFCQTREDCRSGSIAIGPLAKSAQVQPDLPPDFHYSSADMKRVILGNWLNKNNDTVMNVRLEQESRIQYNIAVEGAKCGPTFAELFFQASSSKMADINFSGSITCYNSVESGDVQVLISGKPYFLKNYMQKADSVNIMIPFTDIPDLGILKNDSLKMFH